MSFTYNGDPSKSQCDLLRFYLGDTDSSAPVLQDEEIAYVVSQYPEKTYKQLAVLFRQMATYYGAKCVKRTLGPQTEDATARLNYYTARANEYEKRSAYLGTPPLPDYASELVFYKDMMANET